MIAAAALFALLARMPISENALYALDDAGISRRELHEIIDVALAAENGLDSEEDRYETLLRTGAVLDTMIGEERFAKFLFALGNPPEKHHSKAILILKYADFSRLNDFEKLKEKLNFTTDISDGAWDWEAIPALTQEEAEALSKGCLGICRALDATGAEERRSMIAAVEKIIAAEDILSEVSYKDIARAANLAGTIMEPVLESGAADFFCGLSKFFELPVSAEHIKTIWETAPMTLIASAQLLKTLEASVVMEKFAEIEGFAGREAEYALCAAVKVFSESETYLLHQTTMTEELNALGTVLSSYGLSGADGLGDFVLSVFLRYPALDDAQLLEAQSILQWDWSILLADTQR